MNILVTGGAGYLGSVLVPMLLAEHDVTVVDNFRHGVPSLAGVCRFARLRIIRQDAGYVDKYLDDIEDADVVIPLAALVGAKACAADPATARRINSEQIKDIVGALRKDQCLIYPCTNSGYGLGGEGLCTEDSPLRPLSTYGKTKVIGESEALRHPNAVSLRFATLFGCSPRMRLDLLVNDLVYRAVHDGYLALFEGGFRRNFLHVRDAALAIIHMMQIRGRGQVYNVGDSRANMTKNALCAMIQKHAWFTWSDAVSETDPDRRDYLVSNEKIEQTGWQPQTTLDEGIAELVRAYAMPFDYGCKN